LQSLLRQALDASTEVRVGWGFTPDLIGEFYRLMQAFCSFEPFMGPLHGGKKETERGEITVEIKENLERWKSHSV